MGEKAGGSPAKRGNTRMKRILALAAVLALLLTACGVEITSVGLPAQLRLEKGQTGPLTVEYCAGEDATEEEIAKAAAKLTLVWSSSDETVATVDQTGLVTAVGGGEADPLLAATEKYKDKKGTGGKQHGK